MSRKEAGNILRSSGHRRANAKAFPLVVTQEEVDLLGGLLHEGID